VLHLMSPFDTFWKLHQVLIKIIYEFDFFSNAIIFLHCVLMLKIIVDMSSILSFAHINWNENLKLDKMDFVMSFLIHSSVFAPLRNSNSKTKGLLKSTSTWVVNKCIYNNSMSILVTYNGNHQFNTWLCSIKLLLFEALPNNFPSQIVLVLDILISWKLH